MNSIRALTAGVFGVCILSLASMAGCNRHETPAKTTSDVMDARSEGDKSVATERSKAAENTVDAAKDANQAEAELAHQSAVGARDVAIAKAEAAHSVTVQSCESRTGDAISACKKQADADLEMARVNANSTERAMDPKR